MLRSPVLPTRRKAVKTYGRASRSKASSFKVFQDVVNRGQAEKKSWPVIPSSPPVIGQQISGSISDINLTGDLDDPFADPLSLPSIEHRIDSQLSLPLVNGAKIANPTASRHNDKRVLKATALREKSTNQPILAKSTESRGAFGSATASILRQNSESHRKKKQKFDNTPRVIHDAKTPLRPRKYRYLKLTGGEQDLLATQSPTRTRGYIAPENESDGAHSEGPTLLGASGIDMDDSASVAPVTWVRERARGIFNGTRKAAGSILGVKPSNAKHREQKDELSKKDSRGVINTYPQVIQKENIDFRAGHSNGVFSKHKGGVNLHKFSQEPLSHPDDYQNKGSGNGGPLGLHRTADPSHQKNFWRSENIQDLLMVASARVQYAKKQKHRNEAPNSFQTSVNISPQGSVYALSGNAMLSSSLLFKSTPKKELYHSGSNKHSLYSDADSFKGGDMEGLLDERLPDEGNEIAICDKNELLNEYEAGAERDTRFTENKYLILRAASSEDELYQAPYGTETPGKGTTEHEEGYEWGGVAENWYKKKNTKILSAPTTNTIDGGSQNGLNRGRRHGKDIIHVGGSRTSKHVQRDPKVKGVADGAGKKPDKSNRARVPLKKKPSGKGGFNKEARKQKPPRGYERLGDDDDMDELQMDLPSMMI